MNFVNRSVKEFVQLIMNYNMNEFRYSLFCEIRATNDEFQHEWIAFCVGTKFDIRSNEFSNENEWRNSIISLTNFQFVQFVRTNNEFTAIRHSFELIQTNFVIRSNELTNFDNENRSSVERIERNSFSTNEIHSIRSERLNEIR